VKLVVHDSTFRRPLLQALHPTTLHALERNPFHVGHNELANYTPEAGERYPEETIGGRESGRL
jgi:hypothetical protein